MHNEQLIPLIESWQNRAHEQLVLADSAESPTARNMLLKSAMLNINLATELVTMNENINSSQAQDTVLKNVITSDEQLSILRESLKTGVILI